MKELREKRAGLITQMREIVTQAKENEGGKLTEEQDTRWGKFDKEQDELLKQIERGERQETLDKEMAGKEAKKIETKKADPAKEYEERYLEYMRTGKAVELEERATVDGQSVGTDADGGYTVPTTWSDQIITATLEFGGIASVANILTTPGGGNMKFPVANDTTNRSVILTEETVADLDKVAFTQKELDAYLLNTKVIPISMQLIQDSNYDITSYIIGLMAIRDARALNYYCTVGTGSSQHNGVVPASYLGEAAAATSITRDDLVNLLHSVDPSYRTNGHFMFNDDTLLAIKKLEIGTNDSRPLWQPGMAFGEPDRIEGKPYVINQDMADIGANAKSVLFGDFKLFTIRMVKGYSIFRFQEKYMNSMQIAVMGWSRSDSELMDAGTHPIKHILHAAS